MEAWYASEDRHIELGKVSHGRWGTLHGMIVSEVSCSVDLDVGIERDHVERMCGHLFVKNVVVGWAVEQMDHGSSMYIF